MVLIEQVIIYSLTIGYVLFIAYAWVMICRGKY